MDWNTWLPLLEATDYTIAREVLLRGVAAIYCTAFLVAFNQFPALLGENGLTPAPEYIARTSSREKPSLFRWRFTPYSDRLLRIVCLIGMVLSLSVVFGLVQLGPAWTTIPVFLLMWWLYQSIVNIGQYYYGFGWESLLLEVGFVVAFLGTPDVAPPLLILLFLRWTLFRVEFGAGMIKMRGDKSWRNLTAMNYHHQTQPMPNPVSRWAHQKPQLWHKSETLGSHVIQLVMPWLLFFPQPIASIAAVVIIFSQLVLVITGNYAWLNWLTILIAFSAISDSFLSALVGGGSPDWGWGHIGAALNGQLELQSPIWWLVLTAVVFVGLCALSWQPLRNLFSPHQLMNASFNRWHLVNVYGAFGSMTQVRREIMIEGTMSSDPSDDDGWQAYEFKGKPGDVFRRPPQVAPYHLRLDWMMWFLVLGSPNQPWFRRLLDKLLDGDPAIRKLLRTDPFDGEPPVLIRVKIFEYRYATAAERRETGQWWWRKELGTLVPPIG
ncbi:lipase maturation factor family protein [Enteractinococcus coprophilus]|uniref:Lipase maturation factor n=1 Tax=Enteractinococcus coprophilus TaxID=1027633 RepID=A0A543AP16_9MICC|nr:lipase maturation factor family protein [Enteractinococcus coprophilus]TQL74323.1 lipase maturation factor [Enteractinococcus coprophilus]